MKLLLDENLSPRLLNRLGELFPGIAHVREVGLKQANDHSIWNWAEQNEFAIVTTDADFVGIFLQRGWPPKIIHLEQCDFPLRVIEEQLRRNAVRITEFEKENRGLLSIRF